MRRIHFCGGDKGGVGKTFFCKVLIDYYENLKIPLLVYDLDKNNRDIFDSGLDEKPVRRRRSLHIKASFFSDNPEYMDTADQVIYDLLEKDRDIVVNLPAGSYSQMQRWWDRNNFSELLAERHIEACHWVLLSGENLAHAERVISTWSMDVVLVRNLYLRTDWRVLNDLIQRKLESLFQQRPTHLPKRDIKFIDLESLSKSVADFLVNKKLLIQDSYLSPDLKILDRQKLITFCKKMHQVLASTGKLPLPDSNSFSLPSSSSGNSDSLDDLSKLLSESDDSADSVQQNSFNLDFDSDSYGHMD